MRRKDSISLLLKKSVIFYYLFDSNRFRSIEIPQPNSFNVIRTKKLRLQAFSCALTFLKCDRSGRETKQQFHLLRSERPKISLSRFCDPIDSSRVSITIRFVFCDFFFGWDLELESKVLWLKVFSFLFDLTAFDFFLKQFSEFFYQFFCWYLQFLNLAIQVFDWKFSSSSFTVICSFSTLQSKCSIGLEFGFVHIALFSFSYLSFFYFYFLRLFCILSDLELVTKGGKNWSLVIAWRILIVGQIIFC